MRRPPFKAVASCPVGRHALLGLAGRGQDRSPRRRPVRDELLTHRGMQQLLAAAAVALLAAPADVTALQRSSLKNYTTSSVSTRPPPSVLLVVVDDLGWRDVGFRGSAGYHTPHIDALARDGTVLTGWYVCRVCAPTRTALMSGRYPWTNGIAAGMIVDGFPSSLPLVAPEPAGKQRPLRTLAERLHAVGYATTAAGKWDCGMERWSRTPTRRGFERFVGFYNAGEDHFTHQVGAMFGPPKFASWMYTDLRNGTQPLSKNGTFSTELFTAAAIEGIVTTPSDQPFFVYLAYQAVHTPLQAAPEAFARCAAIADTARRTYCAMMMGVDDGIGAVMAELEVVGRSNSTVTILTTDNGGTALGAGSNTPLRGAKATTFE